MPNLCLFIRFSMGGLTLSLMQLEYQYNANATRTLTAAIQALVFWLCLYDKV
jgi:hypothetical protein